MTPRTSGRLASHTRWGRMALGAYRMCLKVYPRGLRERYGDQLEVTFQEGLAERMEHGGTVRTLWMTLAECVDAVHRGLRARVLSTPHSPSQKTRNFTMDPLLQDLRFAIRTLVRAPGFSMVVVFTLALGIGATTAIFSVVDGIMFRPLPFPESDRLVAVWADYTERPVVLPDRRREWLSFPNFYDLKDGAEAFEEMSLYTGWAPTLTGTSEARMLTGARVSAGMISRVLGINAALGRTFVAADDEPGAAPVVILSHGLWQRAFGGDSSVVGRDIMLSGEAHTVVGVMPSGFVPPFFANAEVWRPLKASPTDFPGGRGSAIVRSIGRLRPGVNVETAQREARSVAAQLEQEYPETNKDIGFNIFPLRFDLVVQARTALWVLLAAVAFVLFIACVNVANLVMARSTGRASELGIRSALGAGRGRIVRQLLTESFVLAGIGGAVGAAVAVLGVPALVSLAPQGIPRIDEVGVDLRVLGFALGVTVLSGVLFGVVPALKSGRADLQPVLKSGGRGADHAAPGKRVRGALVVGQVAMALVLLVGAGLLLRSFQKLNAADLGFDPSNVLSFSINLPQSTYEDGDAIELFYRDFIERVQALPGVRQAGAVSSLPMGGRDGDTGFQLEGEPPAPRERPNIAWIRFATPRYFETMGIELVAGRPFEEHEDRDGARVIIVNESLANRYFPDGEAVGQRLNFNDPENPVWREIVGVARDIRNFGIRAESRNAAYFPFYQVRRGFMSVVLKTDVEPTSLTPAVRGELSALDPNLAAANISEMEEVVAGSLATDRFTTMLLTLFAGAALLLAVVGLYGVVSYGVSRRVHEIGVRMALGASRWDVRRRVLGASLGLVAVGLVIGVTGAVMLTRSMQGLLFEVRPVDLPTYTGVVLLLLGVATVAAALPARRAARVDPMSVLNVE